MLQLFLFEHQLQIERFYNIDTRKTTNNGIEINAEIKNENELKVNQP